MRNERANDGPPQGRRPRPPIEYLWLALPVALVVWSGFLHRLPLLDFWWHLKTGEVIVNTGSIPRADLFSYTAAGEAFVPFCWLAQAAYYLTFSAGGLPLLVALNTLVLVLALLPVYRLCLEEAGGHTRLGVLAAVLAAVALSVYGAMRPQVFSFALFGAFSWVLAGYVRRRRRLLWLLPPLMVLWVNLHGAFVLGLVVGGLYLGCETVRRLALGKTLETLSGRELAGLFAALALTVGATLLNAEGVGIYSFVRSIQTNPAVQLTISEWQPPRLDDWGGVLCFFGPFFLTLAVLLLGPVRPDLTEGALFLAASALGFLAVRNGIWFSLLAAPMVARRLPGLAAAVARSRVAQPPQGDMPTPRLERALFGTVAAALLAVTVLLSPWIRPHLGNERLGDALWDRATPVGAADFLERDRVEGKTFHPQVYGDYLVWRLWPQQRCFIDGRVHLYSPAVVRDYQAAFHDSDWEERLARHDVAYLLLSKGEEDNQRLLREARASARWYVVYEDEVSVVFEKVP